MLLSLVLPVRPPQPLEVPVNLGVELQAWFLRTVGALDRALWQQLHAPNVPRPYTISTLCGDGPRPPQARAWDGVARLSPNSTYWVRMTSTDAALSDFLALRWQPSLPGAIHLECCGPLAIVDDLRQAVAPGWSAMESVNALDARVRALDAPAVELHFASPTVFRSQGVHVPLPLPRLIFQSLAMAWRRLPNAPPLPAGLDAVLESDLLLSRFRLHTERVVLQQHGKARELTAFAGHCRFALDRLGGETAHAVRLLAHFARYAGVGSHTAMGLGQARPI